MAAVTTNQGTPSTVAQFAYTGGGRRRTLWQAAGAIAQAFAVVTSPAAGLSGLDSFGRVADQHAMNVTGQTLFRSQLTYDAIGNLRSSLVTQSSVNGAPVINARSQVHAYDGLNRLVKSEVGVMVTPGGVPSIDPNQRMRSDVWQLDLLGSWVGAVETGYSMGPTIPQAAGRWSVGNLDGYGTPWAPPDADAADDSLLRRQEVNLHNELTQVSLNDNGTGQGAGSAAGGPALAEPRFDEAGNLIFDGQYFYQYDAWNRLVQVNQASAPPNPPSGPLPPLTIGPMIKHHTYDGLSRLIRTQSPYPDPQTAGGNLRSERFYYDGVRRIQEVVTDPIDDTDDAAMGGDPAAIESLAANPDLDPDAATLGTENSQLEGGAAASSGGGAPPPVPGVTLAREYIWGPGDNGFDELLVQYDENRVPWWPIQDAAGDLVALCDLNGPAGGGQPATARVAAQWVYDAYGAILAADHLHTLSLPHLGHKGLFHDRVDVGIVGSQSSAETPRLVPFAHSIYHVRNRAYSPATGRWLQRDTNQTGMRLAAESLFHGRGTTAITLAFHYQGLYGDGANLYEYLGSNPGLRRDVLGLVWDPFSMVDEYLAESAANKAAFLGQLGAGAKAAAIIGLTVASYLPFPFAGNIADLGLYVLGEQTPEAIAAGAALGLLPGGRLLGHAIHFIGKLGATAWKWAKHYAMKFGKPILKYMASLSPLSLARRALDYLRRTCFRCFEAGTLVWTTRGLVSIESVRAGDTVVARDGHSAELQLRAVVRTFVRYGAPIVAVTLTSAALGTEEIRTTEEHPFFVQQLGWRAAGALRPGDRLDTMEGTAIVTSVMFTGTRTRVYNLEVVGIHTYHVGANGILVHNTGPCKLSIRNKLPPDQLKYRPRRRGEAPFGADGNRVELHHVDQTDDGPIDEMLRGAHRGQGNFGPNHPNTGQQPSQIDRRAFGDEKWLYWEEQWDTGRFDDLPPPP